MTVDRERSVTTENPVLPEGSALSKLSLELSSKGRRRRQRRPIEGALQDVAVNIEAIELYGDESTPGHRIAVASAVREAIRNAGGAVMRPLMTITVVVPHDKMGAVLGDLQSRSAMISGTEQDTETASIHGECALEALLGYTTELRSMTQGRGQFTMEFARFDIG